MIEIDYNAGMEKGSASAETQEGVVEGAVTEDIILRGSSAFGGQPSWIVTTRVEADVNFYIL